METKYDINEKIYIPATVTKVTKTSDGKVYYRLESDIGNWDLTVTENQVDQLCLVIPDAYFVLKEHNVGWTKDAGKTIEIIHTDGTTLIFGRDKDFK